MDFPSEGFLGGRPGRRRAIERGGSKSSRTGTISTLAKRTIVASVTCRFRRPALPASDRAPRDIRRLSGWYYAVPCRPASEPRKPRVHTEAAGLRDAARGAEASTHEAQAAAQEASASAGTTRKQVVVDGSRDPETAQHIQDAQKAGHPTRLTVERNGASARRRAATSGVRREAGRDVDEYPWAMTRSRFEHAVGAKRR